MNVTLINHTQHAQELLIFTKATRLNMTPGLMDEIMGWPQEKKDSEIAYMSKTIKSSWEFADCVFVIEGTTRACAQQITRTRQASYAMQSQRVLDLRDACVTNPLPEHAVGHFAFDAVVGQMMAGYMSLMDAGVAAQDARGILPMNIQCNLVAKYNLRNLTDLVKTRKSLRAQGEYSEIADRMEAAVLAVWPWAAPFFVPDNLVAIQMLREVAESLGITTGKGPGWEIAKAIDLLMKA